MSGNLIAIDPQQLRELQQYCQITDATVESCIAEALSEYLYVTVQSRTEAYYRGRGCAVVNELGSSIDLVQ